MENKDSAEKAVREIRRKTRRRFSAEEKIRIVLEGLRGEESIASLCRREGIADYNRRFARVPRSEHDAHRPLQPSDDLTRIFTWHETRLLSKSLTLNYKHVLYVLDPTDAARAARGQRARIEERADGFLSFWHGEHTLLATAFPKEHGVQQGEVVENKRLSEVMDFIQERQRERTEAKIAKPSTTLRKARLLRAGAQRRTAAGSSAEGQS
jgi:transposase-like protein